MKYIEKRLHGDVIVKLTDLKEVHGEILNTKLIQESEHPHVYLGDADLVQNESGKFLQVFSEAKLVHQSSVHKHADMVLTKGIYKLSQVVEMNPITKIVAPVVD
jgi:hypothetical protein